MHRDGTLLNCVVLLSQPGRDFDGGGTAFAPPLDRTYHTAQGDGLCSSGQLLHGAAPVERGVRYVLVCFIDELFADLGDAVDAARSDEQTPARVAAGRARLEQALDALRLREADMHADAAADASDDESSVAVS